MTDDNETTAPERKVERTADFDVLDVRSALKGLSLLCRDFLALGPDHVLPPGYSSIIQVEDDLFIEVAISSVPVLRASD